MGISVFLLWGICRVLGYVIMSGGGSKISIIIEVFLVLRICFLIGSVDGLNLVFLEIFLKIYYFWKEKKIKG